MSTSRQFGTAPDGRLFRTYRGGIYLPSTLWQVLQKARERGVHPRSGSTPRWPASLTTSATRRLLAPQRRTPGPLVAEWAGHTVEVLYRIYAHCIDGDDERWFGATRWRRC